MTEHQPAPLPEVFASLNRLLVHNARDWGADRADAWLYGVLIGWDCEEQHQHDGVCGGDGAMRGRAAAHHWSEDDVVRLRRYRAAVRAATLSPSPGDAPSGSA